MQNEFIKNLIGNNKIGHCLEIDFFYASHSTPSVPSRDFAEDLINRSHIILKLAYWFSEELHAYGISFINGDAKWEEIEVASTYWAAGVNYNKFI